MGDLSATCDFPGGDLDPLSPPLNLHMHLHALKFAINGRRSSLNYVVYIGTV